jgi:hypothetical protein
MATITKVESEHAKSVLRDVLKPGDTVYTLVIRRSASGMMRKVRVFAVNQLGRIVDITEQVARATCRTIDKHGNLTVNGCGFCVSDHIVSHLADVLYPDQCDFKEGQYALRASSL